MCQTLAVSYSAYYHWTKKDKFQVKRTDILKAKIKSIFHENKEIYGGPRIKELLDREGIKLSVSYVNRLMKQMGLKSILSKKYVVTTNSKHHYKVNANHLKRSFTSNKLGEKWVSDISYVKVGHQWNYLTVILDLADRKVVDWSVSKTMKVEETILTAWNKAKTHRDITNNFIFHSDRGVQYASNKMRTIFSSNTKITQSMSNKGDCWDNAVAESFFKTIKYEWLNRFRFENTIELNTVIDQYIQWYNTKRIHSALGYKTPLERQVELQNKNYQKVA